MIECPMCGHRHQRYIKEGHIVEDGRYSYGDPIEDICPLKSACSKEPISKAIVASAKRDGIVIKSDADLIRDNFLKDRWVEIHGK